MRGDTFISPWPARSFGVTIPSDPDLTLLNFSPKSNKQHPLSERLGTWMLDNTPILKNHSPGKWNYGASCLLNVTTNRTPQPNSTMTSSISDSPSRYFSSFCSSGIRVLCSSNNGVESKKQRWHSFRRAVEKAHRNSSLRKDKDLCFVEPCWLS